MCAAALPTWAARRGFWTLEEHCSGTPVSPSGKNGSDTTPLQSLASISSQRQGSRSCGGGGRGGRVCGCSVGAGGCEHDQPLVGAAALLLEVPQVRHPLSVLRPWEAPCLRGSARAYPSPYPPRCALSPVVVQGQARHRFWAAASAAAQQPAGGVHTLLRHPARGGAWGLGLGSQLAWRTVTLGISKEHYTHRGRDGKGPAHGCDARA